MCRLLIIGVAALIFATAIPAAAQPRPEEVIEHLHDLCDQDYKPACIHFGFMMGKLQQAQLEEWRRRHPDWWWWERW